MAASDRWDWWNDRAEAEGRDLSWSPSDDQPSRAELAADEEETRRLARLEARRENERGRAG